MCAMLLTCCRLQHSYLLAKVAVERQRERRLQEFVLTYTPDPDPSGEALQTMSEGVQHSKFPLYCVLSDVCAVTVVVLFVFPYPIPSPHLLPTDPFMEFQPVDQALRKKAGYIFLRRCLTVCLSVCQSVCLSVCQSVCLSVLYLICFHSKQAYACTHTPNTVLSAV